MGCKKISWTVSQCSGDWTTRTRTVILAVFVFAHGVGVGKAHGSWEFVVEYHPPALKHASGLGK